MDGVSVESNKTASIKVIAHLYDFFWERFHYSSPTSHTIKDLLATHFPPQNNQIRHTAINSSIVQDELKKRKEIKAVVVTNIFYFEELETQSMLLFTSCLIYQIESIRNRELKIKNYKRGV